MKKHERQVVEKLIKKYIDAKKENHNLREDKISMLLFFGLMMLALAMLMCLGWC